MADPDIEELIKEIAVKNGVAVAASDPIMIVHTANARLLRQTMDSQEEILNHFKSELEEMSQRWGLDAKSKAEKILSAAFDASRQSMQSLIEDNAKAVSGVINTEIEKSVAKLRRPINEARYIATLNIVAACITLVGAAVAAWIATH